MSYLWLSGAPSALVRRLVRVWPCASPLTVPQSDLKQLHTNEHSRAILYNMKSAVLSVRELSLAQRHAKALVRRFVRVWPRASPPMVPKSYLRQLHTNEHSRAIF